MSWNCKGGGRDQTFSKPKASRLLTWRWSDPWSRSFKHQYTPATLVPFALTSAHYIIQIHNSVLWNWQYFVEYSPHSIWMWRIFHIILAVPHNIVMDMYNVRLFLPLEECHTTLKASLSYYQHNVKPRSHCNTYKLPAVILGNELHV